MILALAACAALAAERSVPALDWKPVSDRNGIAIFKCAVPGTGIVGFRGVGIVSSPLLKVAHIITDPTRGTEWIDSLVESHVVRRVDDLNFIEYDRVGMPPVIMKDRDFVSHVSLAANPVARRITITFRSVDDTAAPPIRRYVRGDILVTKFTLAAVDDHRTQVDAEIVCDPKGYVPKWIVNWFQAGWPRTTMERLRVQSSKQDVTDDPVLAPLFGAVPTP